MTAIQPTIGQIVDYHPDPLGSFAPSIYAAVVTHVGQYRGTVHLTVFPSNDTPTNRFNVPFNQSGDPQPSGHWCEAQRQAPVVAAPPPGGESCDAVKSVEARVQADGEFMGIRLPSSHQIGDRVFLSGRVYATLFSEGKVQYDVMLEDDRLVGGVDSVVVRSNHLGR
jgi:hypothetical protein